MAGLFGFFDYTRPGPGIPKDALPKARIIVFFEILQRKFWKLIQINMIFFLFNIPALLLTLILAQTFLPLETIKNEEVNTIIHVIISAFFISIPIIAVGPAQAGFTYVLRNFAREEHAFIWWDFKESALRNLKDSLKICFIDLAVVILMCMDILVYKNLYKNGLAFQIAGIIVYIGFIIYTMMHLYIYPMLVTFKLNIRQIYKNALIFAIIKFFPNLFILLICAVVLMASFYYFVIGCILFPILTMSIIGFITNFYVYPKMKKYIIDAVEANNNKIEQ